MTERRVVYFPKPEMCVLWNHEFAGQMSDGVYENNPVTDTDLGIKWWYSTAKVGDPSQNNRDCPYILLNLVYELEKCQLDRYISYAILITEKPHFLSKFKREHTWFFEEIAENVWQSHYTELDKNFKERFNRAIRYISFEDAIKLFKKWSYAAAWCRTMKLVKEMDSYIH